MERSWFVFFGFHGIVFFLICLCRHVVCFLGFLGLNRLGGSLVLENFWIIVYFVFVKEEGKVSLFRFCLVFGGLSFLCCGIFGVFQTPSKDRGWFGALVFSEFPRVFVFFFVCFALGFCKKTNNYCHLFLQVRRRKKNGHPRFFLFCVHPWRKERVVWGLVCLFFDLNFWKEISGP